MIYTLKENEYSIISDEVALRSDLSALSKALYYWIAVQKNNSKFDCEDVKNHFMESEKDLKSAVKELVKAGYIAQKHSAYRTYWKSKDYKPKKKPKKPKLEISEDVKMVFGHWNEQDIIKHRKLTKDIRKQIDKKLEDYSASHICSIINRYNKVLKDNDYFFNHIWRLETFLKRNGGFRDFLDDGEKWLNYLDRKEEEKPESMEKRRKYE